GAGAKAIAGSSKTWAPYSSLIVWLATILLTAVMYSSPIRCAAAASQMEPGKQFVATAVMVWHTSHKRFGLKQFQIGLQGREAVPKLVVNRSLQRRNCPAAGLADGGYRPG